MRKRRNRINRNSLRTKPQEITVCLESNEKHKLSSWISAIATMGILGMTIWAGLFSDFSKIAEASLRQENISLKDDRASLESEVHDLSLKKKTLDLEISELKIALESQNVDYQKRESFLKALNTEIENLEVSTTKMESALFEGQLTIYKNKLSRSLYTAKLPEFIRVFAEHRQKRIFNVTNDESLPSNLKNKEILEVTFDGMLVYLEDIKSSAKTKVEIEAFKHLHERFQVKCGSKEIFIQKVSSKHNLDLNADAKSDFLYDILMDEEYACFS